MMTLISSKTLENTSPTGVVMSGMRATGALHLGHYFGVLKNWAILQQQHRAYFMVADWHSLTTKFDDTQHIAQHRLDMVMDWLAAGLDPNACTIYVQSAIPEIAELHLLLSMITPQKWCETDPTLKDMVLSGEMSYGLLGYPVLQTADILAMRGSLVPVGKDQLAHLEISRDIARRFNHVTGQAVFAEPKPLLTETPSVIGLDGRKMSKSYGNTVALSMTPDETQGAIKKAMTDAKRIKKDDPGTPEDCVAVYPWYQLLADAPTCATVAEECRSATRGCMACKAQLAEVVNETLAPLRKRRNTYAEDVAQVEAILVAGNAQARDQAAGVLASVRHAFRI
jgi:tryptophanyl-tRNA synthetase